MNVLFRMNITAVRYLWVVSTLDFRSRIFGWGLKYNDVKERKEESLAHHAHCLPQKSICPISQTSLTSGCLPRMSVLIHLPCSLENML